jgi:putative transposase
VFQNPTRSVHELWQTDFTYFRVVGWGWYFLSTILDDYSRCIIIWRLMTTMAASDVTATLEDALKAARLSKARVHHKPRLLSDNGPSKHLFGRDCTGISHLIYYEFNKV